MLAYADDELVGKNWLELTHPDDREKEQAQFSRLLGGGLKGFTLEKRFLRRDGKTVTASLSVQCMRKDDGSVDCAFAVVQDLADRNLSS